MVNERSALRHLMALLRLEGLSGREKPVADYVTQQLIKAGCHSGWIRFDRAQRLIGRDYEVGNLIVKIPGTLEGPRILLSAHLDKVPLCRGAVPVRRGVKIIAKGKTALGADDRAGVACLLAAVETLLQRQVPHPPLTLLFSVGEEAGLFGARAVNAADLGRPAMGFNFDGGSPTEAEIGAVGAERWEVEIHGLSSHAGVAPEKGISAALIFGKAAASIAQQGLQGRVRRGKKRGTANIGIVRGGEATNQVLDYLYVKGESRSHDQAFAGEITREIRKAFESAARSVRNKTGRTGSCLFRSWSEYTAFRLSRRDPVVRYAARAMKRLNLRMKVTVSDGGLDANYLTEKGIPTVTLGAGAHHPHMVEEYVAVPEFLTACRLAVQLACGDH